MRVVIIYRPRNAPPPEAAPEMFQMTADWLTRYRDSFEVLEFFANGGGLGITDVDDSADVQRMMAEHPFTPFMDVEVRPVVGADTALQNLQEAAAAASG